MYEAIHLKNKVFASRKKNTENSYLYLNSGTREDSIAIFANRKILNNISFRELTPDHIGLSQQPRSIYNLIELFKTGNSFIIFDVTHAYPPLRKSYGLKKNRDKIEVTNAIEATVEAFIEASNTRKDKILSLVVQKDSNFFSSHSDRIFNKTLKSMWRNLRKDQKRSSTFIYKNFTDIYKSALEHYYYIGCLFWQNPKRTIHALDFLLDFSDAIDREPLMEQITNCWSEATTKKLNIYLHCDSIADYSKFKNKLLRIKTVHGIVLDETPTLIGLDSFSTLSYAAFQHLESSENVLFIDANKPKEAKVVVFYAR